MKTVRNNPGAAVVYPVAANLQAGIHRSKMAVFDIDDTLFDTSQRETNAKRAGLAPATPYTGDRKPSEYPKGKKAFMDFFNSPKQFRIDPIFPGALDHVRTLVRDGYTIAYLTGRPHAYFNATMEHLKEKGFPVFNDGNGQPLLFMKPNKKKKTAEFKYNVMRNLQGKFDIHYFYDDLKENRDMAFKLGVIGVYDLRDRLDVRNNPAPNCGCGQTPCKTYGSRSNPLVPGVGRVPFTSQQLQNIQQQVNVGATSQDVEEMSEQEMRQILMMAAAAANPHGGGHPTQLERFLQEQEEEKEERRMGTKGGTTASASTYRWRGNPPISAYLRDVDRRYIDEVKPKIKLVSPIVRDKDSRYMGVFEVPVMDKYYNSAVGRYNVKQVGTTRLLFYTRTGTGSASVMHADIAEAQRLLRAFRDATDRTEKKKARLELIADSPFIRNVVGGTHGQPWAQDFSSLMWAVMLGQGNGYSAMHSKWYIKPSKRELFNKGAPSTTPPFPSSNLEPEFKSRFAHRTMFYAGVALAELFSNPQSMWSGRTLTTKDEINSFITNYGGTISNSIAEMKAIFGNPPAGYREAAGCIVQRGSDKKILLLRRSIHETSFHGMYELPGGKLEEGETPKEAALIETKEEAGLDVRIVQTLQPHIDHDMKKVYHGFVGAPKKGAKVKISEEHDEYKWVSIKQALALPSGKLSHHARFLLGAMQAEESIKGTKIVKQPGPDGKNCGNCAHYCSKTNTCHLWSKKKGSKVFVLPDWFCQGYAAMPLPNPLPKPRKKNGRKEPSKKFVDRMMGNTKMRAEFPDAGQRYAVTLRLVEKHYGKAARKKIAPRTNPSEDWLSKDLASIDPYLGIDYMDAKKWAQALANRDQKTWYIYNETFAHSVAMMEGGWHISAVKIPREGTVVSVMAVEPETRVNPSNILPIYSGEPKGMTKNLGAVFAEIQVGRNIFADIGEGVQDIYRGLVGGRQSATEKRMAMAIAEMQKELSDRAKALGGNAIGNLKVDYEWPAQAGDITLIATADAIKMRSPPKKNPAPSKKLKRAKDKYKKFHGGKEPVSVKSETIDVGDVWYALGPCWSIGYMSPKETGDDEQKYIHHTNEDSKDGNFPMMYATMPENGEPMIVIKGGSMKIGMRDGLAWLID
jgi:8-oxo-dGTP pyrophosphatase MutT (NUDIX family)/uncharacterized protein YbjQ (UPF0145 family)